MRSEGCHLHVQIRVGTSKAAITENGTSTPERGVALEACRHDGTTPEHPTSVADRINRACEGRPASPRPRTLPTERAGVILGKDVTGEG